MITAKALPANYQIAITGPTSRIIADAPVAKGGAGAGLRPHELLEAALASCMAITLRMYADKHNFVLPEFEVTITVNRDQPERTIFEYALAWLGPIEPERAERLAQLLERCAVRKTLEQEISFQKV